LIWIIGEDTDRPLRSRLQEIIKSTHHRIARWVAAFMLALFAAKVYIYSIYSTTGDFATSRRVTPGGSPLDAVVMPETFPFWQVAVAVNAILAWSVYLAAEWMAAGWDSGWRISEKKSKVMFYWLSLVRGVLSVYTIGCGTYFAASATEWFGLPPMGVGVLPWW
jgi:hypothetical protein